MTASVRRFLTRVVSTSDRYRSSGSALVEFVFLAVLLMVPLFYLVMVLSRVQAGTYAVAAAAREAGRAYVSSPTPDQAPGRARAAAGLAFADQGFAGVGAVTLRCDGAPCLRPDGRVEATASVTVPLPLVPELFADIVPLEVPLSARHVATVDRYRGG